MTESSHKRFQIAEKSFAAIAKKGIREIASKVAFSQKKEAEVDIVVSEMVSNLIKHTSDGGEILVRIMNEKEGSGLEMISIDSGPGIKDIKKMTADGVSTTQTLGQGLGAISRLSDEFDIYSVPGWGTVVLSRIWNKEKKEQKKNSLELGAVLVAKEHEEVCGDSWSFSESANDLKIIVFDGLGHGLLAHKASEEAMAVFDSNTNLLPNEQLEIIHKNIKGTRGGVGFILHIKKDKMNCIYSGIGNISCKGVTYQFIKNLRSSNGTIGHVMPAKIENLSIDLNEFEFLVVHTDGLKGQFEPNKHQGLHKHHPSLIAACIYNDQNRGTDDTTVVVIKLKKF